MQRPSVNLTWVRKFLFFAATRIESMSSKLHTIPKSPTSHRLVFDPLPQVIDGKIYFLEILNLRPQDSPPMKQVLAFDLGIMRFIVFC